MGLGYFLFGIGLARYGLMQLLKAIRNFILATYILPYNRREREREEEKCNEKKLENERNVRNFQFSMPNLCHAKKKRTNTKYKIQRKSQLVVPKCVVIPTGNTPPYS